ncbi:MAG: hypothetical protein C0467_15860 [Planctomycetaceae bacterium]|nr:hypothetical protein [Planctomycetaceae bacterium]
MPALVFKKNSPNVGRVPQRRPTRVHLSSPRPVVITGAAGATKAKPARFSMVAYTGEPMRLDSSAVPVVVDLETADLSQQRIPALYDHLPEIGSVVGHVDSLTINRGHLIAAGAFLSPGVARGCAAQVLQYAQSGYPWQASVGADPATVETVREGEIGIANWGRQYPGPCSIGRGCRFRELSFVVLGGDRQTSVVVANRFKRNPINSSPRPRPVAAVRSPALVRMTPNRIGNTTTAKPARTATMPTPPRPKPPRCPNAVYASGRACPFGVVSDGPVTSPDPASAVHTLIARGSLTAALLGTNARPQTDAIRLLVAHDYRRELASTADRSLIVWEEPGGVFWKTNPATIRGRSAMRFIADHPELSGCSPGITATLSRREQTRGKPVLVVGAGFLREISIAATPAFNGTFVRLH